MAVSQRESTTRPDSPPKAMRKKRPRKQENSIVCVKQQKTKSFKTKKSSVQRLDDSCSSVMERAKAVQANLGQEFPSFVKNMLHSHVIHGFWLGLPKKFCDAHMPIKDTMITLEDEDGKQWESKYLSVKVGLSGGWRGFSIDHNLADGDVAVFQLVSKFKFKVFIIRLDGSDVVDCALVLLELEANHIGQVESDDDPNIDNEQRNYYEILDQSDKDSGGDLSPEVSDGIRHSESTVAIGEVKSAEDFEILANGLVINSEILKYIRGKYYELCRSRGCVLHENLLEGLNCKLVAGVISETVNVADAIRASKITTPVGDLSTWDKTLGAFEGLGMGLGFLRARLGRLMGLTSKSARFKRVGAERDAARDELRDLEVKVSEVRERVSRLDSEFKTLGADFHGLELTFMEVASAPW